jgi:hypothetical protein
MPRGIYKRTIKIRKGISDSRFGKRSNAWKGDNAGYVAIHMWVTRWKGKPNYCENCGTTEKRKYEWANIDHKYHRVLDDYIRMCTSCHRKYDKTLL